MSYIRRIKDVAGLCLLSAMSLLGCRKTASQPPAIELRNPALQERLVTLLRHDVPVISVAEAYRQRDQVQFLDTRSAEEYGVSHIPGALHVNYDAVTNDELAQLPRDKALVLYCSVGYRSERITRRLQSLGYTQVSNLYGSLFEWAERGHPMEDQLGQPVRSVHTYNRKWSKYIDHPDVSEQY